MINSIRSASVATWALAAVTLALLSGLFRRSPVGLFLVITAGMELYGLRDNRFLVWQVVPALASLVGIAIGPLLGLRKKHTG